MSSIKFNFLALSLLRLTNTSAAQHSRQNDSEKDVSKNKDLCVVSWKKGTDTIRQKLLKVVLTAEKNTFEHEIVSRLGRRYLLTIHLNTYKSLKLEHWQISLREIISKSGKKKQLGKDSLRQNEPGHSLDYFRKKT